MQETLTKAEYLFTTILVPVLWKVVGAILLWIVGGWLIGFASRVLREAMSARKLDNTLTAYVDASLRVILRIVLLLAVLSVFGVETTSFVALAAAAGVAIGAAWGGLLANFAAGIFLIILRPFKVGDMISAAGVTGDVREIGLFATTLDTPDNVRVTVGNNKIFSDNIINYTNNPYRRVDLKAQLAHTVDPKDAAARIKAKLAQIPNVMNTPAPDVEIIEFNPAGTLLAVRPYCHNKDYWQVYFDTNNAILAACGEAGYPVPAPHSVLIQRAG
ncbi:MAG: mechanosensitive ion channel family protein [Rhodocyclaceae bacterium]|nr:mechanosensitive ion channel family protein [Rhodocyclaceae bacterium]MBX3669302.1 mechanosensitive ion channel family protein [Rhodocyclaceae bacterium]